MSAGRAVTNVRRMLVTAQVALSVVLLIGAGLFIRSVEKLFAVDTGLHANRLLSFSIDASGRNQHTDPRFALDLQTRLSRIPGVLSTTGSAMPLLAGLYTTNTIFVEGYAMKPGEDMQAGWNATLPGFFSTLGIALLAGRDLSERDTQGAPPVAIVNETFAKRFFGSPEAAIGRQIGPPRNLVPQGVPFLYEIAGVVKDSKSVDLRQPIRPWTYMPALQQSRTATTFYVASSNKPEILIESIRQAVREMDPSLVIYNVKTLESQVQETHFKEILLARLSTAFAGAATLMASVGVFGITSFAVARRTSEIGIRMAFGATRLKVLRLVIGEVFRLTVIGIGIGTIASFALAKPLQSQLYGVGAIEPFITGLAIATILGVSLLAVLFPAQRAIQIEPVIALRHE